MTGQSFLSTGPVCSSSFRTTAGEGDIFVWFGGNGCRLDLTLGAANGALFVWFYVAPI